MANGIGGKSLEALGKWGLDKVIENWPAILLFTLSGGAMTYVASISEWLRPYGAVAFGAIGLLSMLLLVLIYLVYAIARGRLSLATFVALKAEAGKINPLEPIHKYERINLSDLFHPFFKPIKNARFENCELLGPGNIVLLGCTLNNCLFSSCEVVIVRSDCPVVGVVAAFDGCLFLHTSLFKVTIFMNRASWVSLPQEMRNQIPVISDTVI